MGLCWSLACAEGAMGTYRICDRQGKVCGEYRRHVKDAILKREKRCWSTTTLLMIDVCCWSSERRASIDYYFLLKIDIDWVGQLAYG